MSKIPYLKTHNKAPVFSDKIWAKKEGKKKYRRLWIFFENQLMRIQKNRIISPTQKLFTALRTGSIKQNKFSGGYALSKLNKIVFLLKKSEKNQKKILETKYVLTFLSRENIQNFIFFVVPNRFHYQNVLGWFEVRFEITKIVKFYSNSKGRKKNGALFYQLR